MRLFRDETSTVSKDQNHKKSEMLFRNENFLLTNEILIISFRSFFLDNFQGKLSFLLCFLSIYFYSFMKICGIEKSRLYKPLCCRLRFSNENIWEDSQSQQVRYQKISLCEVISCTSAENLIHSPVFQSSNSHCLDFRLKDESMKYILHCKLSKNAWSRTD